MHDIIIIGGGISGLYAYYSLKKKYNDINVVLLEKNDYFGGRIYQHNEKLLGNNFSFPAGAARFNKNHKEVIKLLKEFKLIDFRKEKGFESDFEFIDTKNQFNKKFNNENGFKYVNQVLKFSKKFKDTELKNLTFKELSEKTLKKDEVEFMLIASGYSGQLKNMNSYDAVKLFVKGINVNLQYWGNKYHLLISKLVSHLKNNKAKLMLNANVNKVINNNDCFDVFYNNNRIQGKNIIFCLPKPALLNIDYLKPIHCIINESVTCKPLCRTYAIFKKEDIWFKDLKNKVVTNDELRYIIPMDSENGLIMISYTDDIYTKYWKAIRNNQNKLKIKIIEHVKNVFNININKPEKVIVFNWDCGVTYWNKNINSEEISKFILNPLPNTYICGENYSLNQSWVEGALESVNSCVKKITL
jgi:monoamine oxidase